MALQQSARVALDRGTAMASWAQGVGVWRGGVALCRMHQKYGTSCVLRRRTRWAPTKSEMPRQAEYTERRRAGQVSVAMA